MPRRVPYFKPRRMQAARREEWGDPFYCGKAWRSTREAVLIRDEYVCQYCGKELHGDDATVDHVIERQDGGLEYDMTNLKAACRTCNSRKGRRRQAERRR
jgi:5-methylcytosine-specific restriction endonuclease McrA